MKTEVRNALRDAIAEEMRKNENVLILGEEVAEYQGAYKVTQGLLKEFGAKRVVDTPITEHGFAGMAVGMAMNGLIPIVEFMTFNFALQAIDQIINSAAKTHYMSDGTVKCPIVFRGPNGSAARVGAQHSQCFASFYAHIPGLIVIAPYFADDCKGLLKAAIRNPNPVIFLEHEMAYGHVHEVDENDLGEDAIYEIGKAKILKEGSDITLIGFSLQIPNLIEAAEIMKESHGIEVEVIDLRTLRPLDFDAIKKSVAKTNNVLVAEEGWAFSGIASEISARIMEECFDDLDSPVERICGSDVPLPYAGNLEKECLPSINKISEKILKILNK